MADGTGRDLRTIVLERYSSSLEERIERQTALFSSIMRDVDRCPFYHGKVPSDLSLETMSRAPVLHYPMVKEAADGKGWDKVLGGKADYMFETSGSTGDAKKVPYSSADMDRIADDYALLMHMIGLKRSDLGWDFGGAYPLLSGEVMERTIAKIPLDDSLATLLRSDTDLVRSLKKASKLERLDAMAGAALLFYLIARTCNDDGYLPGIVKSQLKRRYHLPGPLASIVTTLYLMGLHRDNLKVLAKGVRFGISYAEPLTAYHEELARAFPNIGMVDVFGATENPIIAAQLRPTDAGLCLFTDSFIAELARPEDVHPSAFGKGLEVQAVPWWDWSKGMRGELLISRRGDCLPLLRYATGDMVEVLDLEHETKIVIEGAEVTVKLPMIKVLGRSVDVLDYEVQDESGNFLGNKVYSRHINDALQGAKNVRWWELYVVKGRPGKLAFVVIPEQEPSDLEEFRKMLMRRLMEECDDPLHTIQVGEELGFFELFVAHPRAYSAIQEEIDRRMREGRSIGQLKPKRIRPISEGELRAALAARGL